jgi:hypothetical protein
MKWERIDLVAQRFERWLVVGFSHIQSGKAYWLCRCDCGNERAVGGDRLRNGKAKSCGCLNIETASSRLRKHGHSAYANAGKSTREYNSWVSMKQRCYNPLSAKFKDYGARGIKVCDRWLHSFANFLADMGLRPVGTTLDRIDSDGDYQPSNCRWATPLEQRHNRRDF